MSDDARHRASQGFAVLRGASRCFVSPHSGLRLDAAADWTARCPWSGQTIAQNSNHRLRAHRLRTEAVSTWGRAFPFEILQLCFGLRVWGPHRLALSPLCIVQSDYSACWICLRWLPSSIGSFPLCCSRCSLFPAPPSTLLCIPFPQAVLCWGLLAGLGFVASFCISAGQPLRTEYRTYVCVQVQVQPGSAPESLRCLPEDRQHSSYDSSAPSLYSVILRNTVTTATCSFRAKVQTTILHKSLHKSS